MTNASSSTPATQRAGLDQLRRIFGEDSVFIVEQDGGIENCYTVLSDALPPRTKRGDFENQFVEKLSLAEGDLLMSEAAQMVCVPCDAIETPEVVARLQAIRDMSAFGLANPLLEKLRASFGDEVNFTRIGGVPTFVLPLAAFEHASAKAVVAALQSVIFAGEPVLSHIGETVPYDLARRDEYKSKVFPVTDETGKKTIGVGLSAQLVDELDRQNRLAGITPDAVSAKMPKNDVIKQLSALYCDKPIFERTIDNQRVYLLPRDTLSGDVCDMNTGELLSITVGVADLQKGIKELLEQIDMRYRPALVGGVNGGCAINAELVDTLARLGKLESIGLVGIHLSAAKRGRE